MLSLDSLDKILERKKNDLIIDKNMKKILEETTIEEEVIEAL